MDYNNFISLQSICYSYCHQDRLWYSQDVSSFCEHVSHGNATSTLQSFQVWPFSLCLNINFFGNQYLRALLPSSSPISRATPSSRRATWRLGLHFSSFLALESFWSDLKSSTDLFILFGNILAVQDQDICGWPLSMMVAVAGDFTCSFDHIHLFDVLAQSMGVG